MKYLSLCAVLRNEVHYVNEWIKYHAALGIEHFYLYENESTDTTYVILLQLQEEYPITLHKIPGTAVQSKVYESCLRTHANDSRWITFIDCDEFIVPSVRLHSWLKPFEKFPGVCMHWYLFGSNGWREYQPIPVVERFTKRQADVNPHIKCFVDPKRTLSYFTPHRFTHTGGKLVDEHLKLVKDNDPVPEGGTCDTIQLNHYCTKSYEECLERRGRPRADTGTMREMPQFFHNHDRNEVEDFKARDFYRSIV